MFVALATHLHRGHILTPNYRPSKGHSLVFDLGEDSSQQCPSQNFGEIDLDRTDFMSNICSEVKKALYERGTNQGEGFQIRSVEVCSYNPVSDGSYFCG